MTIFLICTIVGAGVPDSPNVGNGLDRSAFKAPLFKGGGSLAKRGRGDKAGISQKPSLIPQSFADANASPLEKGAFKGLI